MTLEQFWTIVLKQWRLIVVCFLVVGAGASLASKLLTPIYQSTVLVQVAISSGVLDGKQNFTVTNYDNLLASEQLIQTETILATSEPVLREVISHHRGLTVEQLAKEVTATAKLNTQLFEIDVQDSSPIRAAVLANDIAATLIRQQRLVLQRGSGQSGDFFVVVQPAQPAPTPVSPKLLLNTGAGLAGGLLLGILLAVLFELLDTRVRTPEALTQLLGWPVLATIWHARSTKKEEVLNPTGHDANVEAFRILRTNLGFSAIDKPVRTLVVTSAMPRDGKSAVAANLAIFMARAGKNTLLIDADLRRPVLHEVFGIPADKMGLSNAVLAFSMPIPTTTSVPPSSILTTPKSSLDPFVYATDIPNLCIMPSGPQPPNPSELLDSKAMLRLFTALASCGAEIVIFDTPLLLGLSDASILASKVDGTLLVVDITRAKKGSLKQAKALLAQAGARVLGCVVNKQRRSRKETTYSYHYYSLDERNNGGNHRTNNVNSLPGLPVTPDVLKKSETLSQPDLVEQNDAKNQNTTNVNSPASPANALDALDQTIKLPLSDRRKDEQREDG